MKKHIIYPAFWNNNSNYLIILSKTGIFYSDQVGGIGCLHPIIEGFYCPVSFEINDQIACEKGCIDIQDEKNRENRKLISEEIDRQLKKKQKKKQQQYILIIIE